MNKIIFNKNLKEENYEKYVMSIFWYITIPSYLLAIIVALIMKNVLPFMLIFIIYCFIDRLSGVNPWLKDILKIIFKNKYARLFRILWFIIPIIVLYNNYIK